MAFQTPKLAPTMAPQTPRMACLAPKMTSELPLQSKPIDQKPSENLWGINILSTSLFSVAHVGSWLRSWPQNGLKAAFTRQDHGPKPSESHRKIFIFSTSLFSVAHVGSWQHSWPQDGLQDLQHEPSKARNAPHSLPTWPSKPLEWLPRWLLKPLGWPASPKMASKPPLRSKPMVQKPSESLRKVINFNKSLFSVAHVASWQPSWPQDGLQDLQHDPSKAQDAPRSLPTWPPKPPR